jgi:hypothetical protein
MTRDRHERKDEPMKLTTMTQVTVDGVMQGNGGAPDEDIALDLVESRADSKGVTVQVYRPAGRPRYAPAAPAQRAKVHP